MNFFEAHVNMLFEQVDQQLYEEKLKSEVKHLLRVVYEEVEKEEEEQQQNLYETIESENVYGESKRNNNINQTAHFLVENVFVELDNEDKNLLKKRRALKKRIAEKRNQKIAGISKRRKQALKEAKLLRSEIHKVSDEVLELEDVVESRVCELMEANCQVEELGMDKENLFNDENNANSKLDNIRTAVNTIKVS